MSLVPVLSGQALGSVSSLQTAVRIWFSSGSIKEVIKIKIVAGWGMLCARSVGILVQVFWVGSKIEVLYLK